MIPAGGKNMLLMLLLCLPFAGFAQTTLLKVNPLGLPVATINGAVEQHFGTRLSLQIGAYHTYFRFKEANYCGWAITPELRYYFRSETQSEARSGAEPPTKLPQGWYMAPFGSYSQILLEQEASGDRNQLEGKARFLGGGMVVGRQWLLGEKERIAINVFAGPRYSQAIGVKGSASLKDYKADFITGGGFWVRSGVMIGYAF